MVDSAIIRFACWYCIVMFTNACGLGWLVIGWWLLFMVALAVGCVFPRIVWAGCDLG